MAQLWRSLSNCAIINPKKWRSLWSSAPHRGESRGLWCKAKPNSAPIYTQYGAVLRTICAERSVHGLLPTHSQGDQDGSCALQSKTTGAVRWDISEATWSAASDFYKPTYDGVSFWALLADVAILRSQDPLVNRACRSKSMTCRQTVRIDEGSCEFLLTGSCSCGFGVGGI